MDYYEELGLSRTASADEIRHAYKTLVRLLHPDGHGDESMRQMGDLQLRRLNSIADILLNPPRRRRYDLSLDNRASAIHPNVVVVPPAVEQNRLSWFSSAVLVVAGLIVGAGGEYFLQRTAWEPPPVRTARPASADAQRPSTIAETPATAQPAPARQQTARLEKREEKTVTAARRAYLPEPTIRPAVRLRPAPAPATVVAAPLTAAAPATQPPLPPPPPAAAAVSTDNTPRATENAVDVASMDGHWLYAPQINAPSPRLYAPEYIELFSHTKAGYVNGSFRSRYYVMNQPLSPNVNFDFRGKFVKPESTLDWYAPDGSRGSITIRILPRGQIKVNWVRTLAGAERSLAYGSAVLIKDSDETP